MLPENQPALHRILGSNNLLFIVPDGYRRKTADEGSLWTACLGLDLADRLHSYGVINTKYKKAITDLADITAIQKRQKIFVDFLGTIRKFKDEITGNNLLPLVLILQTAPAETPSDNLLIFGYGQGERGRPDRPHRPTISPSLLSRIRMAVEDQGIETAVADLASPYTGRETRSLNQLFRQKTGLPKFHDPAVRSLLLTVSADLVRDRKKALHTATVLAAALQPFCMDMSLVRRVEISNIDTQSQGDMRFIFRVHDDDPSQSMLREAYLEELAISIRNNGLLHPLVLLQKKDGRYKILCGFRRFQALRRLDWQWVEAKVYHEEDFTTEDFFNISLAENTRRRNLNPLEIGNFLESASREMNLNNAQLAEQFGASLGIGRPGQKVSQSTIHKYRKVNLIRERGESAQMIADLVDEKLPFSIAAEVLAPISDAEDRDRLYLEIIQPLSPTRPQLLQIMNLLADLDPALGTAMAAEPVQEALATALQSDHKASTFIRQLQLTGCSSLPERKAGFEKQVHRLRTTFFGKKACKRDFNITPPGRMNKQEVTLHIRFRGSQIPETAKRLKQLLEDEDQLAELMKLLEP